MLDTYKLILTVRHIVYCIRAREVFTGMARNLQAREDAELARVYCALCRFSSGYGRSTVSGRVYMGMRDTY
jgi:hypothetical protein